MLPIRQHILATIGPLYDTNSTDSECYAIVLPAPLALGGWKQCFSYNILRPVIFRALKNPSNSFRNCLGKSSI